MYTEDDVRRVRDVFAKHGVEYMFIGMGAAIIQGFNSTTQDIDVYPEKSTENSQRLLAALMELGFHFDDKAKQEILAGKDFIQLRAPFDLDVVFAPDGFETYEQASQFKKTVADFPVLSIKGIIINKKAARRPKDRMVIPYLQEFEKYSNGK